MNELSKIEALLFAYGEPMGVKKIAKLLDVDEKKINELLSEFGKTLKENDRGLVLLQNGDNVQLAVKPEFFPMIEGLVKEETKGDLTPAALETLALVAYLGPISRPEIDYYRGVNSSFSLRGLLMRDLVEKIPDPGKRGFSLYRTSFGLLKHLGLENVEALPDFGKFRELLNVKKENSPEQ